MLATRQSALVARIARNTYRIAAAVEVLRRYQHAGHSFVRCDRSFVRARIMFPTHAYHPRVASRSRSSILQCEGNEGGRAAGIVDGGMGAGDTAEHQCTRRCGVGGRRCRAMWTTAMDRNYFFAGVRGWVTGRRDVAMMVVELTHGVGGMDDAATTKIDARSEETMTPRRRTRSTKRSGGWERGESTIVV